jgi:hypothetical protein
LLERRDGKSCFHRKALTPELEKEVDNALKTALAASTKRGWLPVADILS